jgi:hypothetical protein
VVPLSEARDQFEKDYILQTLAAQQGNMSRTAEVLGVERSNLYKKLRAFGITPRGGPELVLEDLIAREPFELQVVLDDCRSAAPAPDPRFHSPARSRRSVRFALDEIEDAEDRRLLVVGEVHRDLDEARSSSGMPIAFTYRRPPLLMRIAEAIFFATSRRFVFRLML